MARKVNKTVKNATLNPVIKEENNNVENTDNHIEPVDNENVDIQAGMIIAELDKEEDSDKTESLEDILPSVIVSAPVVSNTVVLNTSVDSAIKGLQQVRIKPNKSVKTFIGDRWYNLEQGKVTTVSQNVKDILMKAGVLDPI